MTKYKITNGIIFLIGFFIAGEASAEFYYSLRLDRCYSEADFQAFTGHPSASITNYSTAVSCNDSVSTLNEFTSTTVPTGQCSAGTGSNRARTNQIGSDYYYVIYACSNGSNWDLLDTDNDGIDNATEGLPDALDETVTGGSIPQCADDEFHTQPDDLQFGDSDTNPFNNTTNRLIYQGCYYDYVDSEPTPNNPPSGFEYVNNCSVHNFTLTNEAIDATDSDTSSLQGNCATQEITNTEVTYIDNCTAELADISYTVNSINTGPNGSNAEVLSEEVIRDGDVTLVQGQTYSKSQVCSSMRLTALEPPDHLDAGSYPRLYSYTRSLDINASSTQTTVLAEYNDFQVINENGSTSSILNQPKTFKGVVLSHLDCSLPENTSNQECGGEGETPIEASEGACTGESGEWCQDVLDNQQTQSNQLDGVIEAIEGIETTSDTDTTEIESKLDTINDSLNNHNQTVPTISEDGFYTPSETTLDDVLEDFKTELEGQPFYFAVQNFFTITINASCPVWTIPSTWVFPSITIDMQCSSVMDLIWPIISGILFITCALIAFRWAVL
jgi:hypothetical protein